MGSSPESFYFDLLIQQPSSFSYVKGIYTITNERVEGILCDSRESRIMLGNQTNQNLDFRLRNTEGRFGFNHADEYITEPATFQFWHGIWSPNNKTAFCAVMGTELLKPGEDVFRRTTFPLLASLANNLREYQNVLVEGSKRAYSPETLLF